MYEKLTPHERAEERLCDIFDVLRAHNHPRSTLSTEKAVERIKTMVRIWLKEDETNNS